MDSATNPVKPPLLPNMAWRWGVPLFALSGMAALVISGGNVTLFLFMNHAMAHIGDAFWGHLTILGDSTVAILFILPFFNRRPDMIWQFILAATLTVFWVHIMKDPGNVRPPMVLPLDSFHIIGPVLMNNSFPSGHAATMFLLAGLFCMQRIDNWIRVLILSLAILVGLSRIACGAHWPMDVLGGALGGWLAASAGIWMGARWQAGLNLWAQRAFALIIILLAVWSTWYYDKGFPDTWLLQSVIIAVCLVLAAPGLWRLFKRRII